MMQFWKMTQQDLKVISIINNQKQETMKTQKTRNEAPKIRVGSIITFTNNRGYQIKITVTRVEEKSWYGTKGGRNSYGTLIDYANRFSDFKITY